MAAVLTAKHVQTGQHQFTLLRYPLWGGATACIARGDRAGRGEHGAYISGQFRMNGCELLVGKVLQSDTTCLGHPNRLPRRLMRDAERNALSHHPFR